MSLPTTHKAIQVSSPSEQRDLIASNETGFIVGKIFVSEMTNPEGLVTYALGDQRGTLSAQGKKVRLMTAQVHEGFGIYVGLADYYGYVYRLDGKMYYVNEDIVSGMQNYTDLVTSGIITILNEVEEDD